MDSTKRVHPPNNFMVISHVLLTLRKTWTFLLLFTPLSVCLTKIIFRVNEVTDKQSVFFQLQRRRGHGESRGLSALLVGTFDSVFDTKPAPYRILHQTPNAPQYYEIASALTRDDIMKDWDWLGNNLFMVLNEMETEEEVTNFTICKIQSLVAHTSQVFEEEISDSSSFKVVASKFKERFNMADDEKLVNYYSCK